MPRSEFWTKSRSLAVWGMLVLMAVCNGLLIKQNLRLRAEIERQKPKILQSGDRVGAFLAPGMGGEAHTVSYNGQGPKRVFLYFSPDCPYCHDQFSFWRELIDRVDKAQFEVTGVVSEAEERARVTDYLRSFGCESLPVVFVSNEVLRNYKLVVTPTTLVVDNGGKVEQAWSGAWDDRGLSAAGSTFGISLQKE